MFLAAWTVLPGSPRVWTLAALAALAFAPLLWLAEIILAPRPFQPWAVLARDLVDDVKTALARAWLQLTFVAFQACQMTHAIAITIARVAVTRRKMLEWQTAATVASQHGLAARNDTRWFVRQMLVSPLFAAVALISRRQKALHDGLIRTMTGHGEKRATDQTGPERITRR